MLAPPGGRVRGHHGRGAAALLRRVLAPRAAQAGRVRDLLLLHARGRAATRLPARHVGRECLDLRCATRGGEKCAPGPVPEHSGEPVARQRQLVTRRGPLLGRVVRRDVRRARARDLAGARGQRARGPPAGVPGPAGLAAEARPLHNRGALPRAPQHPGEPPAGRPAVPGGRGPARGARGLRQRALPPPRRPLAGRTHPPGPEREPQPARRPARQPAALRGAAHARAGPQPHRGRLPRGAWRPQQPALPAPGVQPVGGRRHRGGPGPAARARLRCLAQPRAGRAAARGHHRRVDGAGLPLRHQHLHLGLHRLAVP
mmetsp:Transcript_73538/g.232224  ORF Transcript_73538/g.232224 Transcript_73538/m.232224 type:complete len:315 (-) Transcript_73538:169-1113(-)